jgi:hypothetical protein
MTRANLNVGNAVHPHHWSIGRQRQRLPGRDENAPIRAAVARSVPVQMLLGRHDDAHQLADSFVQRARRGLPMTTATPKSP